MPRALPTPFPSLPRWRSLLAAGLLASASHSALATIGLPLEGDFPAELVLTIWDPVAKASYTYDTGVSMDAFLETAQTDAGYQKFWVLDPTTDPALKLFQDGFRAMNTAKSSLLWFVAGVDSDGFGDPGDFRMATTLRATTIAGQTSDAYARLLDYTTFAFNVDNSNVHFYFADLNNDSSNPNNFHGALGTGGPGNVEFNGSSYTIEGQQGYVDGPRQPWLLSSAAGINLTNPVGRSSWFYYLQNDIQETLQEKVIVDEFDNLTNDGYWGLDIAPDGTFVLSYSLFTTGPSAAQRTFAASIGRTELNGGFRTIALAGAAALSSDGRAYATGRPLALGGVTSPVPEPATVALMGLGLAAVMGTAARRRRKS